MPDYARSYHRTTVEYFIVQVDRLVLVDRDRIENAWTGKSPWIGDGSELRIVTVLHDGTKAPVACYFLRVPIVDGRIVIQESIQTAVLHRALAKANGQSDLTLDYDRQMAGFPSDWAGQIARALEVNASSLVNKGPGGPLLTAVTMGKTIQQAARMHAESNRLMSLQEELI